MTTKTDVAPEFKLHALHAPIAGPRNLLKSSDRVAKDCAANKLGSENEKSIIDCCFDQSLMTPANHLG